MKKNGGFSLTEIIAVIVIMAVLAAIMTPRFLNQRRMGVIAEAQQMLGAIRLKQLIKRDTRGSFIVAWCTPGTACGATAGNGWAGLGLQDIPAQATYAYTCPDVTGTGVPTFCITTPILGSPAGAIRIDLATGFWGCNTPYRPLPNNQGCTI